MSGARALAAARARRAGGASISSKQSSPPQNSSQNNVPPPPKANQQPKMNPAMMLLSHNKIIENLQAICTDLTVRVDEQSSQISNSLNSLSLDDNNIVFFKEKLTKLEKELSDIKKYILKVQTFSMETNLQCNEFKRRFEIIEQQLKIETNNSSNELVLDENINETVSSLLEE